MLFVDDDLELLDIAKLLLQKDDPDMVIEIATSAKEALHRLKTDGFDAVISDYLMPEMTGLELLAAIRESGLDLPFVIFTGKSTEDVAIKALNLGATHYLEKSESPKAQYALLTDIIRRAVLQQREIKVLKGRIKSWETKLISEPDNQDLDHLLRTLAHDLKTGLQAISNIAELEHMKSKSERAAEIVELTQGMSGILDSTMRFAEIGRVVCERESVDLTKVLTSLATGIVPESVDFEFDNLPKVECDRNQLTQLFQNMIVNAVEHGSPERIWVTTEYSAGFVHILFNNDGKPIDAKTRSEIFKPRFSTKKEGGLGLAIVKRIVDAHGWEISLDESEDVTRFRLSIPLSHVSK